MPDHRVVIVGGGFGGLFAALALARAPVQITLLDRKNHHVFQPLLYQVATAGLNPSDIAAPIRHVLRGQENATVLLADVTAVDLPGRRVRLEGGDEVPYDTLILATGARHAYFGHPEWERNAPGLKTIDDALAIRRRIFSAFEVAERETDPERRKAWLTFVVVGAGPTGVELAGAISEIARASMKRDFRRINPAEARILLLEGSPHVLGAYPESLQEKAIASLHHLGVEVQTGRVVTGIVDGSVTVGDDHIATHTVLWAAGVAASPLLKTLGVPLDRAGRAIVEPDLSLPGYPEAYVIGDAAAIQQEGKLVPGVAGAAVQGGRHTAENIARVLRGEPRLPFHYVDKGSLATIGRASAIADFGRVKLSGFIAWVAWLTIHVSLLIGFRNRFLVVVQWAFSYVTYERGARLITGGRGSLAPQPPLAKVEGELER